MRLTVVTTIVAVTYVYILPLVLLYARRRWLTRQGGLFDCAHRTRDGGPGVGWVLSFTRCREDRLDWYRAFLLALRPSRSSSRAGASWQRRRIATALEEVALLDNSWIITIKGRFTGHGHNLAIDLENVLGLMAWLEPAPPGSHYLSGSTDSSL